MEESKKLPRVIKKDHVSFRSAKDGAGGSPASSLPNLKINEKDGRVESIEVFCTCGGKTVIQCDYESAAKDEPSKVPNGGSES